MKEQFVPYGIALQLKKLGFDEPCINHWEKGTDGHGWGLFSSGQWLSYKDLITEYKDNEGNLCGEFSAPLWQQAFDWFRINYKLEVTLSPDSINVPEIYLREYIITSTDKSIVLEKVCDQKYWIREGCFKSYEESRQKCLEKLIKIIKNEKV